MSDMIPATPEAYDLLHQGTLTLSKIEATGMCVDEGYIDQAIRDTTSKIQRLQAALQSNEIYKVWQKSYGPKMNLDAGSQLADVLYKRMGFECLTFTEHDLPSTDEAALVKIDHPFIKAYLEIKKLDKCVTTLGGIKREVVDGLIHCIYNLNIPRTYRSGCSNFNFMNIPVRFPEVAKIIRGAFRARKGRRVVEIDYNGAEVKGAACYHKDPVMLEYINNKTKDMHRDMAMELYLLEQAEVTKEIRHRAKNMFVFPEFYGDWYKHCAEQLWEEAPKLKTTSGIKLLKHLKSVGLSQLGVHKRGEGPTKGTFEHHVQKVEQNFWGKRFPVYAQWKDDWYEAYLKKGEFLTLSGFVCRGYMKKNDVINYPVQGWAFHWLLWSLIQIVNKELDRKGMGTVIVGQIHDSIVADVVDSELDEFLIMCQKVMTVKTRRHWPTIITPLEIEAEAAPVDGSWADKVKCPIKV